MYNLSRKHRMQGNKKQKQMKGRNKRLKSRNNKPQDTGMAKTQHIKISGERAGKNTQE